MKIVEQIWNTESKTELSAQRVELETAMELNKINQELISLERKIEKVTQEGMKLVRQNNEIAKKLESISSEARKLDNDYNAMALTGHKARLAFQKAAEKLGLGTEYRSNVDFQGLGNRLDKYNQKTKDLKSLVNTRGTTISL